MRMHVLDMCARRFWSSISLRCSGRSASMTNGCGLTHRASARRKPPRRVASVIPRPTRLRESNPARPWVRRGRSSSGRSPPPNAPTRSALRSRMREDAICAGTAFGARYGPGQTAPQGELGDPSAHAKAARVRPTFRQRRGAPTRSRTSFKVARAVGFEGRRSGARSRVDNPGVADAGIGSIRATPSATRSAANGPCWAAMYLAALAAADKGVP